jgi:hypothetical protein
MKLVFLPANRVWAFAFGDSLVPLNGRTLFATKKEALAAAQELGIELT